MKNILLALLLSAPASAAELRGDAEAGLVSTTGNARSQTWSAKNETSLHNGRDTYSITGRYLENRSNSVLSAQNWAVGARYEREITEDFSGFLAELLESDRFAGILQRYNTDVGLKHYFAKREKDLTVFAEGGYRYTAEHTTTELHNKFQKARVYAEGEKYWTPTFSTKLWVEYVPNFTVPQAWLLNSELSVSAALSSVFALKTAYLVRYNHAPPVASAEKADTTFTTALAAKF